MQLATGHEHWSSRLAFLMATVGSAVGLGNIWRFPYSAGMNGGGAYVLIYIAAVLLVATPILITELMLGRRGQMSPPSSMGKLATEIKASRKWKGLGYAGLFTALCILSFYSVIGGWALAYIPALGSGVLAGAPADKITGVFTDLVSNPWTLLFWHSLFILVTVLISLRGIRGGIEKAVNILMPMLFLMLVIMVAYAAAAGNFAAAVDFLFTRDFSKTARRRKKRKHLW